MLPRPAAAAGALILAGCLTPAVDVAEQAAEVQGLRPQVVLALIDTGINPWHEAFRWRAELPPFPAPAITVPSAFQEVLADEGLEAWNRLEPNQLYWFEGTRILAISKVERLPEEVRALELAFPLDPHRIYDDVNHGTATASVAASVSPHAWIVMVETDSPDLEGFLWAVEQPWIDIISSSRGNLGHGPSNLSSGKDAWAAALRSGVDAGKVAISSGGNYPDPNLFSASGAPWVISVGAAQGDEHGVVPLTSQPVDVVADFVVDNLARNRSNNETFTSAGTSFGAPLVAAVLAEAAYQIRLAYGHEGGIADGALIRTSDVTLTTQDFRRALNLTARYWETTEHSPALNVSRPPVFEAYGSTTPALPHLEGTPVGPWVQMGWGYVDASTIQAIVDLLTGRAEPPDKADASAYMQRLYETRSTLWELAQRSE